MEKFPCLPLIAERHINAVRSRGEEYKYPELEVEVFPQVWGSTALGFGGIGGQAMTSAYTAVVQDLNQGWCSVFFGERLAYLIYNPNDIFFDDLNKRKMRPVYHSYVYHRDTDISLDGV